MNEILKLNEAKYFWGLLKKIKTANKYFKYNLNAFLSTARSVLHYAYEEAGETPAGQRWYAQQMKNHPILNFFKEKQEIDIFAISSTNESHSHERIILSQPTGTVPEDWITKNEIISLPDNNSIEKVTTVLNAYKVSDWPGKENLKILCERYLADLDAFIKSGKDRYISG